jgi:predicted nucleotidyltransferase
MERTEAHETLVLGPNERAMISRLLREHGVTRASLFGSFVRGEQHAGSDVDLLIEPPLGMTLLDLARLEIALEELLGRHVDLVTFDEILPALRDRVLREQEALL